MNRFTRSLTFRGLLAALAGAWQWTREGDPAPEARERMAERLADFREGGGAAPVIESILDVDGSDSAYHAGRQLVVEWSVEDSQQVRRLLRAVPSGRSEKEFARRTGAALAASAVASSFRETYSADESQLIAAILDECTHYESVNREAMSVQP